MKKRDAIPKASVHEPPNPAQGGPPAGPLSGLEALLPALLTGRERMPAWGGAALALAIAGLAVCAWQWQRVHGRVAVAEERANQAQDERDRALEEAGAARGQAATYDARLAAKEAELGAKNEILVARDAQLAAREQELAAQAARADALQQEIDLVEAHGGDVAAVLREELAAAHAARVAAENAAAEGQTVANSACGERDAEVLLRHEVEGRLAAAEAELERARTPAARAAERAEIALDWLASGRASDAGLLAQAIVLEHADQTGPRGLDVLTALADSAAALESWAAETDVALRSGHLARADQQLAAARATLLALGDASAEGAQAASPEWLAWLATPEHTGRARLQAACDALQLRLDAARGDLGARRDEEWRIASQCDPLVDPGPLIAWARAHGDAAPLAPMVERVAAALAALASEDGALDPPALAAVPSLAAWAGFLRESTALAELPAALDVRRHALAARWTDADAANDAIDWELLDASAPATARAWTAVLALEQALLAPGSAFPLPRSGRLVYRVVAPGGALTGYEVEEVSAESGAASEWTLRRRLFDAEGRELSRSAPYSVLRRGQAPHRIEERASGRVWATLRADLAGSVAAWTLPIVDLPAGQAEFVSADALAELRADWSSPRAALVLAPEGRERWYVPGLGLVREQRASDQRELVAADLAP